LTSPGSTSSGLLRARPAVETAWSRAFCAASIWRAPWKAQTTSSPKIFARASWKRACGTKKIPLEYGFIGQENDRLIGGICHALRTIPQM
jgi:hypothetical protein